MKTKDKVKYWLDKHPSLRDGDNRLSANIWAEELTVLGSNDNINWTSLKIFTGLSRPSYGTTQNLIVQATQYFSYYAFCCTMNNNIII